MKLTFPDRKVLFLNIQLKDDLPRAPKKIANYFGKCRRIASVS